jgi:hypothetical protein
VAGANHQFTTFLRFLGLSAKAKISYQTTKKSIETTHWGRSMIMGNNIGNKGKKVEEVCDALVNLVFFCVFLITIFMNII